MNDKGKQFYDYLVSKEIKVPSTYEEFQSSMQDSDTAGQFHSFVKSKGIAVPESVDEFSSVFAIDSDVKKKDTTSVSPTQDGVSVSTEPEIGLDESGQEVSLAPSEETPEYLKSTSYGELKRQQKVAPVQSYEQTQKALSGIDKAISAGEMTDMSAKDRMLLGVSQGSIDQRVDELKTQREAVAKTSDQLVEETQKDVTNIVNEGIGDNWKDFVGDDGVVDVSKVGDFARTSAREYGVPEDGYFFQRVKDAAQAKIELEQIRPATESILLGGSPMAPKGVNIDGETISIVRKRSVKLDEESDDSSTVLMASHGNYSPPDAEGKFVAFPTIFPKDPKKQTGRVEDWIVAENEDQAYEIAKERGEVLYYDTPEEANAVAEGSWKEEKTKGLYEEMYGVKPEDDAEKMLSREDVQKYLGLSQLNADFSIQMEQLKKNIEKSSGEEIDRINQERYGMSVDDYASSIANDYKQTQESLSSQYKALEDRYAPFINEKNEFTGGPEMYQEYNATLEQLNNANAASNELYKTQFESLVSQNTKDVASINNKYNRRFNRQQQEIFNAYKSEYADKAEGISPMLQSKYQKAYGRALEKAMKAEGIKKDVKAMIGGPFGANIAANLGLSAYVSGLSNNVKSLSRAMGFDGEFWEQVAKDFEVGDTQMDGFKDWINPSKLIKSTAYTVGGMTPGLLASIGTGGVGAYTGAGALATTLAAGTAGWGVESATIVQDAYDQKFKETASATKAEDAASKSLKGQVMLMPMYALEMVPFFGDLATKLGKIGLDNMAARFAVGGAIETIAEMGQEYPQQLFEQAIADDKDLSDAFDYASVKGFKDTFVNVAPTTLLLGGGGAALDIKTSKEDMARSLAMKVKMGNLTDAALEQNMLKMTVNEGQKFAKAFIDTQLRNGSITEEQATKATLAIESSVATIEKGKEYNLDNKNNYILATLDLKLKAAKEKAEAETDPMMKGIAEKKVKKIESQAEQLLETGNADVAVVTYPDNSFDILTHDEARLAMSRDEFLQNFANGDLKVEAMGNGQSKLMSELEEKSKPFAPEEKTTTEEDKFEASIREEKAKGKKKGILRTIGDKISKASAKRYNKKYYASLDKIYQDELDYHERSLERAREEGDDLDIDYYENRIKEIKSSSPEQVAQKELDYQKQRLEEDFVSDEEISRSLQIDTVAGIERLEELLGQTPTQEEVARREFIIDNVKDDTQVTEQERLDTEEQGREEDTGEVQEPEVSEEERAAGPVLQEQEETVSTSEDKLREMEANARKKHRLNPVKRNRKLAAIRAVRSAMQSLSGIAPDAKIVVHDTAESYAKAADEIERSKQDLSKGAWDPDTNTIHINLDKAGSRTVAHETFHALLFNRFKDEGKIQVASEKLISELRPALRGDAKLTAYLDEFATRYSDQDVVSEEQLAELIGFIAENYSSFNARAKRAVENFINTVMSALGVDKIEGLFPKKISGNEAADMMTAIGERIAKGEVITEKDIAGIDPEYLEVGPEKETVSRGKKKKQAEKLFLSDKNPKLKSTKDVAEFLQNWSENNKVFDKDIKNVPDNEVVDEFVDHITAELLAWEKVRGSEYVSFYDEDIKKGANPMLQEYAEKEYGRPLTESEVKLYHLVSAFASPSASPLLDSWKGFDIFDRWMRTGELSGYSDKVATVWETTTSKTGKKVRKDTGRPRLDKEGNPVRSKVSPAYSQTGLDKFNLVLEKFNGDLDKTMDWFTSKQSYSEMAKMLELPDKGPKSKKGNEYLSKDEGGIGIFGLTGAKLGSYILNRYGNFSTVTKDMWYARTMARLAGEDLVSVNKKTGKEGAVKTPWAESSKEGKRKRKLADEAFRRVAKKFGTSPAMIQERIWDFEKRLYEMLGANEDAAYVSDGLKRGIEEKAKAKPKKKKQEVDPKLKELREESIDFIEAEDGAMSDPPVRKIKKQEGFKPKKTQKAYKLFTRGPKGKIYPLFVDANTEVPVGDWMEAVFPDYRFTAPNGRMYVPSRSTEGVKEAKATGDSIKIPNQEVRDMLIDAGFLPKGSKAGTIKAVAARPGWHAGDVPVATHIGKELTVNGKKYKYRGPAQAWAEVEVPADKDWQSIANDRADRKKDGTINVKTAHVTDEIPFDGFYRYKTNPNMLGNWIISGQVKVNKLLSDSELQEIYDKEGISDIPSLPQLIDKEGFTLADLDKATAKRLKEFYPEKYAEVEEKVGDKVVGKTQPFGKRKKQEGAPMFSGKNRNIIDIANRYIRRKGLDKPVDQEIKKLNTEYAKKMADVYEAAKHEPLKKEVQDAYKALAEESKEQFEILKRAGYKVELWDGVGEPYKGSREMLEDLKKNKHLYVFSTEQGFGEKEITAKDREENPMLEDSGYKDVNGKRLLLNDLFRFVHDAFGHGKLGNSFGPIGEENAWYVHSQMFSPAARRAMTSETRGQNSWFNFGPQLRNKDGSLPKKGDKNYVPLAKRDFAEQKNFLFPDEYVFDRPNTQGRFEEPGKKPKIKKQEVAKNSKASVDAIKKVPLKEEDGVTLNVDGTPYQGGGLIVPFESINLNQPSITPQDISTFVDERSEKISSDSFKVGLYKFPEESTVSIDLNVVVPSENRKVAVEFAKFLGQESVYDIDTGENIKTGATGMETLTLTNEETIEAEKALMENKMPKFKKKKQEDVKQRGFFTNKFDSVKNWLETRSGQEGIVDHILENPETYYTKQKLSEVEDKLKFMTESQLVEAMSTDALYNLTNRATSSFNTLQGGPSVPENIGILAAVENINRKLEKNQPIDSDVIMLGKFGTALGQLLRQMGHIKSSTPAGALLVIEKIADKYNVSLTKENRRVLEGKIKDRFAITSEIDKLVEKIRRKDITDSEFKDLDKKIKDLKSDLENVHTFTQRYLAKAIPLPFFKAFGVMLQGALLTTGSIVTNFYANVFQTGQFLGTNVLASTAELARRGTEKVFGLKPKERNFSVSIGGILYGTQTAIGSLPNIARTLFWKGPKEDYIELQHADIRSNILGWRALTVLFSRKMALPTPKEGKTIDKIIGKFNKELGEKKLAAKLDIFLSLLSQGTMGIYSDASFRALQAGDLLFKIPWKNFSLYEKARRKGLKGAELKAFLKYPDKKSYDEAVQLAKEATFQEESKIAQVSSKILASAMRGADKIPVFGGLAHLLLRTAFTYVKTPANLVNLTIKVVFPELSYATSAYHFAKGNYRQGAMNFGIATTGIMMTSAASMLVANGLVQDSGEDDDADERGQKYIVFPPNTINITAFNRVKDWIKEGYDTSDTEFINRLNMLYKGEAPKELTNPRVTDVKRNYMKSGIPGAVVGIYAQTRAETIKEANSKDLLNPSKKGYFSALGRDVLNLPSVISYMTQQSFLQGAYGLMNALSGSDHETKMWYLNTFKAVSSVPLPNQLSVINRAEREYLPDFRHRDWKEQFKNVLLDKTFGTSALPVRRDMWGRRIRQTPEGVNPVVFQYGLDPTRPYKGKESPTDEDKMVNAVMEELYTLWDRTRDSKIYPDPVDDRQSLKWKGESRGIYFSPQSKNDYQMIVGGARLNRVVNELSNKNKRRVWDRMTDDQKINKLSKLYRVNDVIVKEIPQEIRDRYGITQKSPTIEKIKIFISQHELMKMIEEGREIE